jgi:hypothetical protein
MLHEWGLQAFRVRRVKAGFKELDMRAVCSKGFLLIATTLLLSCSHRAGAETPDGHSARSWLDHAVSEKRCPSSPVNIGADHHGDGLLSRITISNNILIINGTDDPDHIS